MRVSNVEIKIRIQKMQIRLNFLDLILIEKTWKNTFFHVFDIRKYVIFDVFSEYGCLNKTLAPSYFREICDFWSKIHDENSWFWCLGRSRSTGRQVSFRSWISQISKFRKKWLIFTSSINFETQFIDILM